MLIITNPKEKGIKYYKRKAIVLTARVHPGEIPGSFAIEGLLKELVSNSHIAQMLRSRYIFYIIPMLNPDGVMAGNSRTSMIG